MKFRARTVAPIGKGGFGSVFRVQYLPTGEAAAGAAHRAGGAAAHLGSAVVPTWASANTQAHLMLSLLCGSVAPRCGHLEAWLHHMRTHHSAHATLNACVQCSPGS